MTFVSTYIFIFSYLTGIFDDNESCNHFCLGLDPGLNDIVHLTNQDGKFEFVTKSAEFHEKAGGNHAQKKTNKWRAKAKIVEIDNCHLVNHLRVSTLKD